MSRPARSRQAGTHHAITAMPTRRREAAWLGDPKRLLRRAQICIADGPDGEPARRQLCAPNRPLVRIWTAPESERGQLSATSKIKW